MKLSNAGAALIEKFEGFSSRPYWDADGRVWTIGYGSTKGVGPNTAPVTRAQARARLKREVDNVYGVAVNRLGVPLTINQFDALCSFTYNLGPGAINSSTGIGWALRIRDWRRAGDEMLKWDKAGGRTLLGLTRRRRAERALFLKSVAKSEAGPATWLTAVELRRCRELDAIRAGRIQPAHDRREIVLVRVLTEQRKRIWRVAQPKSKGGDGRGWGVFHRTKRYRSLLARTR
jgi:GH24 family phage-related lysozyme (muramidase)